MIRVDARPLEIQITINYHTRGAQSWLKLHAPVNQYGNRCGYGSTTICAHRTSADYYHLQTYDVCDSKCSRFP